MPIPSARYGLVIAMALSHAGCYSGGRWTMPDLAFWKTNPFSPSSRSTAPEPIPRPAELAQQPGPPPGSGYARSGSDTAGTEAPPFASNSAGLAGQQPRYPVTQPDRGGPLPPYMAPQEGRYDLGDREPPSQGRLASLGTPSNRTAGSTLPHATGPASGLVPGGNVQSGAGGHGSPTPYSADTSPGSQGYDMPSGYAWAEASGPYANPARRDPQEYYDAQLADYRNTAGMYGSPIPDYRGDYSRDLSGQGHQGAPSDYRSQPAHHPAYASEGPHGPTDTGPPTNYGTNTPHGYYPPDSAGQHPPRDWQHGGGAPQGERPSAGGYIPGDTGYHPPGVPPYQPPSVSGPADTGSFPSDSGYSPGSVSRYESWQR